MRKLFDTEDESELIVNEEVPVNQEQIQQLYLELSVLNDKIKDLNNALLLYKNQNTVGINTGAITTSSINTKDLIVLNPVDFSQITTNNLTVKDLTNLKDLIAEQMSALNASISSLQSANITVDEITSQIANLETINARTANIQNWIIKQLNVEQIEAEKINVPNITNNTLVNKNVQTNEITAEKTTTETLNTNVSTTIDSTVDNTHIISIDWKQYQTILDQNLYYIEIPYFENGSYYIALKADETTLATMELSNSMNNNYRISWGQKEAGYFTAIYLYHSKVYIACSNQNAENTKLYFASINLKNPGILNTYDILDIIPEDEFIIDTINGNKYYTNIITPLSDPKPLKVQTTDDIRYATDDYEYDVSERVDAFVYKPNQSLNKEDTVDFEKVNSVFLEVDELKINTFYETPHYVDNVEWTDEQKLEAVKERGDILYVTASSVEKGKTDPAKRLLNIEKDGTLSVNIDWQNQYRTDTTTPTLELWNKWLSYKNLGMNTQNGYTFEEIEYPTAVDTELLPTLMTQFSTSLGGGECDNKIYFFVKAPEQILVDGQLTGFAKEDDTLFVMANGTTIDLTTVYRLYQYGKNVPYTHNDILNKTVTTGLTLWFEKSNNFTVKDGKITSYSFSGRSYTQNVAQNVWPQYANDGINYTKTTGKSKGFTRLSYDNEQYNANEVTVIDNEIVKTENKPLIYDVEKRILKETETLDITSLNTKGNVEITGTLDVKDVSTFEKDVDIKGNATIAQDTTIAGNLDVNGIKSNKDVHISGDLYVSGTTHTSKSEDLTTGADLITLRANATSGLADGQVSGIVVNKYDGSQDLSLVTDNEGTLRVGTATGTTNTLNNIAIKDNTFYTWTDAYTFTEITDTNTLNILKTGTITGWTGKTSKDGYDIYDTITITSIDKSSLVPLLARDEDSAMTNGGLLKWDASSYIAKTTDVNNVINDLANGTSDVDDNTLLITDNADNNKWYKRPFSKVWNYIKSKIQGNSFVRSTNETLTDGWFQLVNTAASGDVYPVVAKTSDSNKISFGIGNAHANKGLYVVDNNGNTNTWLIRSDNAGKAQIDLPLQVNGNTTTTGLTTTNGINVGKGIADYNNSNQYIQVGCAGDGIAAANLLYLAGYTHNNGMKIKDVSKEVLMEWIKDLTLNTLTMKGNISFAGSKATKDMIRFLNNTSDTFGNGISIGGGGMTVIGGGESASLFTDSTGLERMIVANDGDVELVSNLNGGLGNGKTARLKTNGNFTAPGFVIPTTQPTLENGSIWIG